MTEQRNMRFLGPVMIATSLVGLTCGGSPKKETSTTVVAEKTAPKTAPNKALDKVTSFAKECREGLQQAKKDLGTILALEGNRTVDNFLIPYNKMLVHLDSSAATAGLMDAVHPNKDIREEAKACEQEAAEFHTELSLHHDLYKLFASLDTSKMDANTKRMVSKVIQDFKRAGVEKEDETLTRLKEIDKEILKQGQEFGNNIVNDVRQIALDSPEQLVGLPADYIRSHTANKDGKIIITTNYPDIGPFMKYAENGEFRKKLYIANKSRADQTNESTLRVLLSLRAEKAKILGYANWADYVTEDKMIKSGAKASAFIQRIAKMAKRRSLRDYRELLKWKRKNLDKRAKKVFDWEKKYIENKVKAAKYSFDPQEVRPYFPYKQVQAGLLDITAKIYGIEYKEDPTAKLWHQDVSAYDVHKEGVKIGRIYLDMHPREGKYGHAAQFSYRTGVQGIQLPEGVLVCNFPNPRTSKGDALMEHSDVVTMFHEFGHLMHHVLGGQGQWFSQSGVATEWDFVEAPSQMFEEWAWNYDTLARFAKHQETGKEIPKEMVKRMRHADSFGLGANIVQQMFYASISLEFHRADPAKLQMSDTVKRLQTKYTPFPFVEGTSFQSNFGHLNGYSAIYYTYMWSLVIAKDLLTPFHKNGLMNLEWTYRYRERLLARGGTKDAADLIADFLGRKYNFKAFEAFLAK